MMGTTRKRIGFIAAAATLLASTGALAASMTIEFTNSSGEMEVWTYRDGGAATGPNGATGSYRWDDDGRRLCTFMAVRGGDASRVCATFSRITPASGVGASSTYTTTEGERGVAVVTAKSN